MIEVVGKLLLSNIMMYSVRLCSIVGLFILRRILNDSFFFQTDAYLIHIYANIAREMNKLASAVDWGSKNNSLDDILRDITEAKIQVD